MNKLLVAMSFIVLIIVGFLLGYTFRVTDLVWESLVTMASYFIALIYVISQFMEKPKNQNKD